MSLTGSVFLKVVKYGYSKSENIMDHFSYELEVLYKQ